MGHDSGLVQRGLFWEGREGGREGMREGGRVVEKEEIVAQICVFVYTRLVWCGSSLWNLVF